MPFAARALGSGAVLSSVLALAATAWGALVWLTWVPRMDGSATMGLGVGIYLVFWVIMMAAMMLPSATPMIMTFHTIAVRGHGGAIALRGTVLFTAGYLALWALAGLFAFALTRVTELMEARGALFGLDKARLGGTILLVAGLYQLTPLKERCLTTCRSPLAFLMTEWREGSLGAFVMGLRHGGWCLGCCWLLFAVLFPLGIMNLAAMAALTLLVSAEKMLPRARSAVWLAGLVLVMLGLAIIFRPDLLQGTPMAVSMTMPAQR